MFRRVTFPLFSRYWSFPSTLSLAVEAAILMGGVWLAFRLRVSEQEVFLRDTWLMRGAVFTGVILGGMYLVGLYDLERQFGIATLWWKVARAFAAALGVLGVLYYLTGDALILGRGVFLIAFLSGFGGVLVWRHGFRWAMRRPLFSERVLIVGTDGSAVDLAKEIISREHLGYRVLGFVGDNPDQVGVSLLNPTVLGTRDEVADLAEAHGATRVVVAQQDYRGKMDLDSLLRCKTAGMKVSSLASYVEEMTGRVMVDDPRLKSWLVFSDEFVVSRNTVVIKRVVDVVIASASLVVGLPIMLLTGLATKLTSKGPVLYTQQRVGKDGKVFTLLKFRSMVVDAEKAGAPQWAVEQDPRMTRFGRMLRRSRLDELPQLVNVLRGDMSLVGPRPERPEFVQELIALNPVYAQRLAVRPGLTGWAQIKAPYAASFEDQMRKLEYDLYYVKKLSAMLDISIMVSTARIMLRGGVPRPVERQSVMRHGIRKEEIVAVREFQGTTGATDGVVDRERSRSDIVSAFSVDVEDYFHVEAFRHILDPADWESMEQRVEPNTRRLLDLLDEFGVKGTFFVLGWVAERSPVLVSDIHAAGHEVAIHGYDHRPITVMTPSEFREDVRRTKGVVESITGEAVLGYRAPNYSVVEETLWALDILMEEGLQYDSSIFPIAHDRYGIPDAQRHPWTVRRGERLLVEFPISTIRVGGRNLPFVGGGYLRLLPMAYVRWGMRRVIDKEGRPLMVYVHPWEIDPDQPVLDVGPLTRLRHYGRLAGVENRLHRLLGEYRFDTVRSVLGLDRVLIKAAPGPEVASQMPVDERPRRTP